MEEDYISEAEAMDDSYFDEEFDEMFYKESRKKKINRKFIIECKNRNKILYYQHISKGGYWTQYKDNSLAFDTIEQAYDAIKNFKYGSFRMIEI